MEAFEFCTLVSINVEKLYNPKTKNINYTLFEELIQTATRFLDNVVDVNEFVYPEFKRKMEGNRKIGIGVLGLAHLLIHMGIPYDSDECLEFIREFFGNMKRFADKYNIELAEEKGVFPNWHESIFNQINIKRRNAAITCIAPTGSCTSISGSVSYGIEPLFGVSYIRNVVNDSFVEVNELFREKLHAEIKNKSKEEKIVREIAEKGSVNIPSVPDNLKRLFRCCNDIPPEWHIKVLSNIQYFIDAGVSKTVNLKSTATLDDVRSAYKLAYQSGCKGITVYRDNSRLNQTMQTSTDTTITDNILQRGEIVPAPELAAGITYKLLSGCGNVYLNITHDSDGNINQTFMSKGSSGTCGSNQEAVSRLTSLALRGGIPIEKVIDQLQSVDVCPSFISARKSGKRISKGSSCPHAMGYALKEANEILHKLNNIVDNKRESTPIPESTPIEPTNKPKCPECGEPIIFVEGCQSCRSCGWSKCS